MVWLWTSTAQYRQPLRHDPIGRADVRLPDQGLGAGRAAHDTFEEVVRSGTHAPDLGGDADTTAVLRAIASLL